MINSNSSTDHQCVWSPIKAENFADAEHFADLEKWSVRWHNAREDRYNLRETIVAVCQSGKGLRAIFKQFGVSYLTLRNIIQKLKKEIHNIW